jgi:hypothetical protein
MLGKSGYFTSMLRVVPDIAARGLSREVWRAKADNLIGLTVRPPSIIRMLITRRLESWSPSLLDFVPLLKTSFVQICHLLSGK